MIGTTEFCVPINPTVLKDSPVSADWDMFNLFAFIVCTTSFTSAMQAGVLIPKFKTFSFQNLAKP